MKPGPTDSKGSPGCELPPSVQERRRVNMASFEEISLRQGLSLNQLLATPGVCFAPYLSVGIIDTRFCAGAGSELSSSCLQQQAFTNLAISLSQQKIFSIAYHLLTFY